MRDRMKPQEPSCHDCPNHLLFSGSDPIKKMGVTMHFGVRFCTYGKRARRFRKSDPKVRVPVWCPRRLKQRRLRIYGFRDPASWMLHERVCRDLGKDISPEGRHYAVEHEKDTELTAKEFLERSVNETDAELLGGIMLMRYQVLEFDDGLKPVFLYKTESGYRYEPYFPVKAAKPFCADDMEDL